jgi:hypothetical protein
MKKVIIIFAVLLSLTVLGACAPVTSGTSASYPVTSKLGLEVVEVMPGETLYIDATDYSPAYFDYDLSQTSRLLNNVTTATKGTSATKGVTNEFSVVEAKSEMPAGWGVKLERAYLRRDVLDSTTSYKTDNLYRWQNVNYTYQDFLNFTFAVNVPVNAPAGSQILTVQLKRDGKVEDVLLFIKVLKQVVASS